MKAILLGKTLNNNKMISEIPLIIFDEFKKRGVKMRKIVVVPYENHWNEKFQMEAERLKSAMPEMVKIHHIGSTSVPGLAAKPIIDMIMEVESIDRVDHWNERFEELGYIVKGENGISGRRFLFMERRKNARIIYVFEKSRDSKAFSIS